MEEKKRIEAELKSLKRNFTKTNQANEWKILQSERKRLHLQVELEEIRKNSTDMEKRTEKLEMCCRGNPFFFFFVQNVRYLPDGKLIFLVYLWKMSQIKFINEMRARISGEIVKT